MKTRFNTANLAIVLSGTAMLSFLGRSLLDYRYVFPEFGITMPALLPVTLGELAFFGGWLWSLVAAAQGSRKGLWAMLVYNLLLLLFGVSTFTMLCPSPCPTAWPLGEGLMWSNVLIGAAASFITLRLLLQRGDSRPTGSEASRI